MSVTHASVHGALRAFEEETKVSVSVCLEGKRKNMYLSFASTFDSSKPVMWQGSIFFYCSAGEFFERTAGASPVLVAFIYIAR